MAVRLRKLAIQTVTDSSSIYTSKKIPVHRARGEQSRKEKLPQVGELKYSKSMQPVVS